MEEIKQTGDIEQIPAQLKPKRIWFLIGIIAAVLIIVLTGIYFYISTNHKVQNSRLRQDFGGQAKLIPSPTINVTANWKTYKSKYYGYSIKYPIYIDLLDCDGHCNYEFRLKNTDLIITFGASDIPTPTPILGYVRNGFCNITKKTESKQEYINNILFYRNVYNFSENNICLEATTELKYSTDKYTYRVLDIQAKAYSQKGINLFNQILSTFKFN